MSKNLLLKKRREEVLDCRIRGITIEKIAGLLNVTPRTINKDIVAIHNEFAKRIQKKDQWRVISDFQLKAERRIKRLWLQILDIKSKPDQVRLAIRELRHEDKWAKEIFQIAGILPKEISPLIEVNNQPTTNVQINIIQPKEKEVKADAKKETEEIKEKEEIKEIQVEETGQMPTK